VWTKLLLIDTTISRRFMKSASIISIVLAAFAAVGSVRAQDIIDVQGLLMNFWWRQNALAVTWE
jgi:hypothetical protein